MQFGQIGNLGNAKNQTNIYREQNKKVFKS